MLPSNAYLLRLENAGNSREVEAGDLRDLAGRETGCAGLLKCCLSRLAALFELLARLLEIGLSAARCFARFGFGCLCHRGDLIGRFPM